MDERMADCYLLNRDELKLLLILKGAKRIYGFEKLGSDELLEENAKKALFSLGQKQLLMPVGEDMHIHGKLNKILDVIVRCSYVFHVKRLHSVPASICVYELEDSAGRVAWMEGVDEHGEVYRLGISDNMVRLLRDKEYLLEQAIADELLYKEEQIEEAESFDVLLSIEAVGIKEGRTEFVIEAGKSQPTDVLYFMNYDNMEYEYYAYSERRLEELLEKIV